MVLSAVKILELNEKHHLIENLSERELNNPEGVGIDLRVGEVYEMEGDGFLGVTDRKMPNIKKIASITDGDKEVTMKPGDYLLVKTIEKFNIPAEKVEIGDGIKRYLTPIINPRSTLQRCGIGLFKTKTDPGYSGELIFGIANLGKQNFKFELGARMFNVLIQEVTGEIKRSYSGQNQGGRVTSDGRQEVQN
ncbi:MAG: hypothetical protein Q7R96_02300 [Nanoarchaeota archaeon]|nr:hypothetical protein [Nanoarchaeota archaeon]